MQNINLLDKRIEQLQKQSNIKISIPLIMDIAKNVNTKQYEDRVPWVDKIRDLDESLGGVGFLSVYDGKQFSFYHLVKYDEIYRPIKYVYMDLCMTWFPAAFSRHLAENACAHVAECVRFYIEQKVGKLNIRIMLGYMLKNYKSLFNPTTYKLIKILNNLIWGRTKHDFRVEPPREQMLSLTESLIVYFVSRILGIRMLQDSGIVTDINNEIQKQAFIGQTW